jgi:hypothetical protein
VRVVNYTGFARLRSVVNDAFSELAIHHFSASVPSLRMHRPFDIFDVITYATLIKYEPLIVQ